MLFRNRAAAKLHQELGIRIAKLGIRPGCENAPDLWFTQDIGEKGSYVQLKDIIQICESCPVQNLCAEYAIEQKEEFGIWGGTTPGQRKILSRLKKSW